MALAQAAEQDAAEWTAVEAGAWPLQRLADDLCSDMVEAAWHLRHGAAVGLRAVLRVHAACAAVTAPTVGLPSGALHGIQNTRESMRKACGKACSVPPTDPRHRIGSEKRFVLFLSNVSASMLCRLLTSTAFMVKHQWRCFYCFAGWLAAEGEGPPQLGSVTAAEGEAAAAANLGWLEDCIVRIVCVLALDRFADFVSDQASASHPPLPLLFQLAAVLSMTRAASAASVSMLIRISAAMLTGA